MIDDKKQMVNAVEGPYFRCQGHCTSEEPREQRGKPRVMHAMEPEDLRWVDERWLCRDCGWHEPTWYRAPRLSSFLRTWWEEVDPYG